MSDLQHPGDETLLRHSAGSLGAGPSVVVAAHVAVCPRCRGRVDEFDAIGGMLLEECPPAEVPEHGLDRVFAAIERGENQISATPKPRARPALPAGVRLPDSASDCDFGAWRSVAPGIRVSRASGEWARKSKLKLLRVEPGSQLLAHGHSGTEWTFVISGAFSDSRARFSIGDLCEVDQSVDHRPLVEGGDACICLVAADGRTRHHGILGRLHQMVFGD